jgi:methylated-DNA-[protein]-cysteine S-methyltransferase
MDIAAYRFPSDWGTLALTWRGNKIHSVHLPEKDDASLLRLVRKRAGNPDLEWSDEAPAYVKKLAQQLQSHLAGDLQRFSVEHLNLEAYTPFFRNVYRSAARIPAGTVKTYGELALQVGSPKAFRAVGQAMAKNPFPLVVPCHRVVGSGRALVGFSAHGGVRTKSRLLELESNHVRRANQS